MTPYLSFSWERIFGFDEDIFGPIATGKPQENLWALMDYVASENKDQMFGKADNIQGEMEGDYAALRLGFEGDYSPEMKILDHEDYDGLIDQSILLWQVGCWPQGPGPFYGEFSERIYFWVNCEDIKNLDFSKARVILQCT